jgi:hypothetical protein
MSYSRFAPDSNVYVFMGTGDKLHCCRCPLDPVGFSMEFIADNPRDMIDHLQRHKEAGHLVPDETIAALEREAQQLDSKRQPHSLW